MRETLLSVLPQLEGDTGEAPEKRAPLLRRAAEQLQGLAAALEGGPGTG